MTPLKKPVKRVVKEILPHARDLVVVIYPSRLLGFRELGRRREYLLPIMTAYRCAIEAHQAFEAELRKASRASKGKKVSRRQAASPYRIV